MIKELDEKRKKEICDCENCGYKNLKHFEECPKCRSISYHLTKFPVTHITEEEERK
jgi:lipopolysaccharide biosynthesis regulator YciM